MSAGLERMQIGIMEVFSTHIHYALTDRGRVWPPRAGRSKLYRKKSVDNEDYDLYAGGVSLQRKDDGSSHTPFSIYALISRVAHKEGQHRTFFPSLLCFSYSTFLLQCAPFFLSREGFLRSLSLVDREFDFYVPTIKLLSTVGTM